MMYTLSLNTVVCCTLFIKFNELNFSKISDHIHKTHSQDFQQCNKYKSLEIVVLAIYSRLI